MHLVLPARLARRYGSQTDASQSSTQKIPLANLSILLVRPGKFVNSEWIGAEQQPPGLDEDGGGFEARPFGRVGSIGAAAVAFAIEMQQETVQGNPDFLRREAHTAGGDNRFEDRCAAALLPLDLAARGLRRGLKLKRGEVDFKRGIAEAVVLAHCRLGQIAECIVDVRF